MRVEVHPLPMRTGYGAYLVDDEALEDGALLGSATNPLEALIEASQVLTSINQEIMRMALAIVEPSKEPDPRD